MATTALTGLTGLLVPLAAIGAMGVMSPAQAAETSCDGRLATIVVPIGASTYATAPVVGTPGDDVIVGTALADTIDGAGGNDAICGFDGGDTLTGGPGDDRLFGGLDDEYSFDDGYVGDLLVPGPGDDHADLGADRDSIDICDCDSAETTDRISYADSPAGVNVNLVTGVASGEGQDTIVSGASVGVLGSPFDDRIVGTEELNVIKAGAGADTVDAGDGDDLVWLDEITTTGDPASSGSPDTLEAGAGRDTVQSSGGDTIDLGPGNDTLYGSTDVRGSVRGGGGDDYILTVGPMAIRGGGGKDQIVASYTRRAGFVLDGGSGRDSMSVRLEPDVPRGRITVDLPKRRLSVAGQKPSVRLSSVESLQVHGLGQTKSRVTFIGTGRADSFRVVRASLRAFGRGGNDSLFGFRGRDLLDGGPGRDTLDGFLGRDRCVNGEKVTQCEVRR